MEYLRCNCLEALNICQKAKLEKRRIEVSLKDLFCDDPFFSHIKRTEIERKLDLSILSTTFSVCRPIHQA
jgi:hypothetical protein